MISEYHKLTLLLLLSILSGCFQEPAKDIQLESIAEKQLFLETIFEKVMFIHKERLQMNSPYTSVDEINTLIEKLDMKDKKQEIDRSLRKEQK